MKPRHVVARQAKHLVEFIIKKNELENFLNLKDSRIIFIRPQKPQLKA